MALTSVTCPECGTEQSSAYGYAPAQTVRCGRCDTTFRVPGPKRVTAVAADDDEADEHPRSKRWILWVAALLVLVGVAMVGAAAYIQAQRERADEEQLAAEDAREEARMRAERAAARARPIKPRDAQPDTNPFFAPPTAQQTKEMLADLGGRLVGVWRGAGTEPPREVEYRADGTFRDGPLAGTWKAVGVSGSKVLKVERSAGRSPVRVTFEGDELIHDGGETGVSAVLRKK